MSLPGRTRVKEKIDRARADEIMQNAAASAAWKVSSKDDRRKTDEWRERMRAQLAGNGEQS